jgi:hypothetical protein
MIGQNTSHHRFTNRNGTDANAWVVTAFGDDFGFIPLRVYSFNGLQYRAGGFYCKTSDDWLTR